MRDNTKTVFSCRKCNAIAGPKVFDSFDEKRDYIRSRRRVKKLVVRGDQRDDGFWDPQPLSYRPVLVGRGLVKTFPGPHFIDEKGSLLCVQAKSSIWNEPDAKKRVYNGRFDV